MAWVLAVGSWVFPVGILAAALFGGLWWFQHDTGRVPPDGNRCRRGRTGGADRLLAVCHITAGVQSAPRA